MLKREKTIWYRHQDPALWLPEYPACSVYTWLERSASHHPASVALEFEGRRYTYAQLMDHIDAAAKALIALGVHKGQCISIVMPNTPQAVFLLYAANRIGAIANMIHPLLSADEIQRFVEATASTAVLTLDVIYPKLAQIVWNYNANPKVILAKIADALPRYAGTLYAIKNRLRLHVAPQHDVLSWNDFITAGKGTPLPPDTGRTEDTAAILYSGGTSGIPKGVELTNGNINALAVQSYDISGMRNVASKKSLAVMPIFHGFGLAVCIHAMLCVSGHVFLIPKYSFTACSRLIFKRKINFVYGVPGLFEALLRSTYMENRDLSFLELLICGGDKLPEKLQHRINKALHKGGSKAEIREAYGQTECVAGCSINPTFDNRIGSAGIAYPDMHFKIVIPGTQNELPDGEAGELCVSGPTVMKGYYQNVQASADALQQHADGRIWLHTGDIFAKDADGYIYFRQRSSRTIICGGYNVYATQIEDVISDCPAVSRCCVVGIKDRVYGQKIAAFVVLKDPNTDPSAAKETILRHCHTRLAAYSVPHHILFKTELPVTNLGKTDYRSLEREFDRNKE